MGSSGRAGAGPAGIRRAVRAIANRSMKDPSTCVRAHFQVPAALLDLFSGALWEAGTTGIELSEPEGETLVDVLAYFPPDTRPASVVERIIPWLKVEDGVDLSRTAWETLEETDWNHIWRSCYRPVPIGDRLVVLPSWSRARFPGRLKVKIKPEMAFGTGSHETTRLCLEALERTPLTGRRVADIGTGSGILAFAAARLGAREVWACDPDPVALANARYNARLNGVAPTVHLLEGEVGALPARPRYDIVIANIVLDPIRESLGAMAERLQQDGAMFLSGLVDGQQGILLPLFEPLGLVLIAERQLNEWILLHLEKQAS